MSAKKERLSQGKPLINRIKHVDVGGFSNNQPYNPWQYASIEMEIPLIIAQDKIL